MIIQELNLHHIHQLPPTCLPHNPNLHTLNLWMMKLPMELQVPLVTMLKLMHLPRLSTRLPKPTTPVPSTNSRKPFHSMVLTPENSTLSSSSANSTSKIIQICFRMIQLRSIIPILSFLKGSKLDCFKPALLDPNEPA